MKLKTSFLVGLALFASVIVSHAQGFSQYAAGGTALPSPSTNYCIIPAELATQMTDSQGRPVSPHPVVTFLSMRAFSTAAVTMQGYYCTNQVGLDTPNSLLTRTNYPIGSNTNGFLLNQWCVIHHIGLPAATADEAVQISAIQTANYTNNLVYTNGYTIFTNQLIYTNALVFATAPVNTVNSGDTLFAETAGASISVVSSQTTPTTITGPGIITGQRAKPLLMLLWATAGTNTIDAVNANFVP